MLVVKQKIYYRFWLEVSPLKSPITQLTDSHYLNDADYVECPECGWTGDVSELVDGCCPDCGACIKDTCEKCGGKKKKACSESVNDILESISNMTEEDLDALKEALKGE